ncbi:sterol desaturase family protein [Pedobacter sp. MC2016-24]|uniref:sterol desaturase family protein n=1 Tax=Pedobacter sp. MC2016-24 TaxID=2780090 RepID=UPI00188178FD|nr:sterol desaturase family protein [Pedobacter sp. MC2016-24]MBE9598123.1 sterol desaturase family protein [Pedobacter sp. MC2016-24]
MSPNKRLKVGQGQISGYISIFLSTVALLGIFCFRYPEQLTTPEFREVYTKESMETLMAGGIVAAFFFALLSLILSKRVKWALIGSGIAGLAILLGAFTVEGRAVEKTSWHFGLDWMLLDLLLMVAIFIPLELFFPKNKSQTKFHEEWRTDLMYFVISHLFIQFFGIVTQKPAVLFFGWIGLDKVHEWVQSLPFLLALLLAFFTTDLFQYWAHRLFHTRVYLWRFHSIHHSTKSMDWLAGSRTHFMDIFFTRAMTFIPLYILGFSSTVFNVYIIFIAIHAVLIHANTRINFGFLKYILTTPQYHHWHHCEDPKYYGHNFASIFPFIDMMFGTYYLPGKKWPAGTGVHEAQYPKGFVRQSIYPFTKSPFDTDLNMDERSER